MSPQLSPYVPQYYSMHHMLTSINWSDAGLQLVDSDLVATIPLEHALQALQCFDMITMEVSGSLAH